MDMEVSILARAQADPRDAERGLPPVLITDTSVWVTLWRLRNAAPSIGLFRSVQTRRKSSPTYGCICAEGFQVFATTAHHLISLGVRPRHMPRGGFCLWRRLPDGLGATTVARAAQARDLILAPGNVFRVSGHAHAFMRFNVAQMRDPVSGRRFEAA